MLKQWRITKDDGVTVEVEARDIGEATELARNRYLLEWDEMLAVECVSIRVKPDQTPDLHIRWSDLRFNQSIL